MNVTSLEVYYCDKDHYTLYARNFGVIDRYSGQDEIKYYFYYGDTEYELGYSGNTQYDENGIPQRDPAVVIDQRIRINHVFYIFDAFRSFEKHQTVTAQTGTEYDGELLCKLLAYVIDNPKKKYNLYDIENTIKHYQPKQRNYANHLTLSSQQNISKKFKFEEDKTCAEFEAQLKAEAEALREAEAKRVTTDTKDAHQALCKAKQNQKYTGSGDSGTPIQITDKKLTVTLPLDHPVTLFRIDFLTAQYVHKDNIHIWYGDSSVPVYLDVWGYPYYQSSSREYKLTKEDFAYFVNTAYNNKVISKKQYNSYFNQSKNWDVDMPTEKSVAFLLNVFIYQNKYVVSSSTSTSVDQAKPQISVGQAKPQTSVGQATERTTDKLPHDLRSALATDTGQKVLGFVQSLAQKAERDTGSGLIKSLTGFLNSVSDAVAPANQGDFVTSKPQKVPSPKEKDAKAHHDHDVRNESDKTETPQEQERIKHVAGQQQPVDSDKPNPSDTIWKIHIFKNQEPNHFDSNSNARIPLKAPVSTSEILVKGRYSIPHEKYSIDDHEYFQVSISENGNLCGGSVNSLNELISIISRADDCYCNKARNWTYDTFSPGSAVDLLKKASDKIYYQNDWVKLERRNGMILFWMNSHPFILSSNSVDDGSVLYIQNESRVIFKIRDFCDIRKTLYLADIGQPVFYHVMGFNAKDYEPFREPDSSYIGPVMASKVPLSLSLICFYIALRFKLGNVWNWKDTDEDTSDEMNPSFQDMLIAHDYVQGKMKPAALCKPHEPQDRHGNPLDLYDHSAKPFGFGWIWHKERWVYVRDKCNPPEKQDWCWMRNGWQFAWKYVGNWSNNDLRPREGFNYSNGDYNYVNDEYNPPSEYSTWVKGDMYSNAHWK